MYVCVCTVAHIIHKYIKPCGASRRRLSRMRFAIPHEATFEVSELLGVINYI